MEWSRGDPVAESGGLGGKLHGHAMTTKVSCDVVPALVLIMVECSCSSCWYCSFHVLIVIALVLIMITCESHHVDIAYAMSSNIVKVALP